MNELIKKIHDFKKKTGCSIVQATIEILKNRDKLKEREVKDENYKRRNSKHSN